MWVCFIQAHKKKAMVMCPRDAFKRAELVEAMSSITQNKVHLSLKRGANGKTWDSSSNAKSRINHFHQWESVQFDQFYNKPKNFEAFTDKLNAPNNRVWYI